MTHPAHHLVDATKKRQKALVEGRLRGGRADRPGKRGALKGGASEDRKTQSDTMPLVPHIKSGKWPVADTVAAAENQPERARGGEIARTPSGSVKASARRKAETEGDTMPGGRFPIHDDADLSNAKQAYGRANDKPAVKRWINKRASELGEPPLGG